MPLPVLNDLVIQPIKDFHGDVDLPHLREAYLAAPTELDTLLTYHFLQQQDMPLTALTEVLGQSESIEGEVYRWDYETTGNIRRNILGSPDTLTGEVGKGFGEFRITMAENAYGYGDVLRLADEEYGDPHKLLVLDSPVNLGGNFIYRVRLATSDPHDYVDARYINGTDGAEASVFRIGQYSEEGSERGGPISWTNHGQLEHALHISRKTHRLTGTAAKQLLRVGLPTEGGGRVFYWVEHAAYKLMASQAMERELLKLYGPRMGGWQNKVSTQYGETGGVLQAGGGLRSQVPKPHRFYYPVTAGLDMDFIDAVLQQLSRSSNMAGGSVEFGIGGGNLFRQRFHQAAAAKYGDLGSVLMDTKFVRQSPGGEQNELSFGSYFRTYDFQNSNRATTYHMPSYDNAELNTLRDPISPMYTLESGRAFIFPIKTAATKDGKNMVRSLHMKDRENVQFSVGGTMDGNGNVQTSLGSVMSNGFDGTEMHSLVHEGIVCLDPPMMAEIIPYIP